MSPDMNKTRYMLSSMKHVRMIRDAHFDEQHEFVASLLWRVATVTPARVVTERELLRC
jgi:hypothetical protein